MNILDEANKIVNDRSEEKEREYGSFSEGMERAAQILTSIRGKKFDAHDMYAAMVALKLSRQSFNFKTDNLLDCVAYLGAWQNYIQEKKDQDKAGYTATGNEKFYPGSNSTALGNAALNVPGMDNFKFPEYLGKEPADEIFSEYVAEDLTQGQSGYYSNTVTDEKPESESPIQKVIARLSESESPIQKVIARLSEIAIDTNEKLDKQITYTDYLAEELDKLITYIEEHVVKISNKKMERMENDIGELRNTQDLQNHVNKNRKVY